MCVCVSVCMCAANEHEPVLIYDCDCTNGTLAQWTQRPRRMIMSDAAHSFVLMVVVFVGHTLWRMF